MIDYTTCRKKQKDVVQAFNGCQNREMKYHRIMELGKEIPSMNEMDMIPENLVSGCQSKMYLASNLTPEGRVIFSLDSDALISKGLGALLLIVYNNENPETILKCPPDFLNELDIPGSLTPSRANGLFSLHLKMKQEAIKYLTSKH